MTPIPLWAQAESEAVRRLWVDAWGLLEESSAMARGVAMRASEEEDWDWEATSLADRIDAFLRQATAAEPIPEAQRPSCANCGATLLAEHPTRCPLCGAPQLKAVP